MRLLLCSLLTLTLAPAADAALIITVGSANLTPGQSGTVDVFVRSTTGTDSLAIASLQFQITPITPGPQTALGFTNPQIESHLTNPGYIFFGNSAAVSFGSSTNIQSLPNLNDTYFGGDGTADGLGVLVPTTDILLAKLDLTAGLGEPGALYQISLVPPSGAFTSFLDPDFNEIPLASSTTGLAQIIPEPATVVVFGVLAAAGFGVRRRKLAKA